MDQKASVPSWQALILKIKLQTRQTIPSPFKFEWKPPKDLHLNTGPS